MSQETEIKISIDDNEAISSLREILDLVERIEKGLEGLQMPAGGGAGGGGAGGGGAGGGGAGGGGAGGGGAGGGGSTTNRVLSPVDQINQGFTVGGLGQRLGQTMREASAALPMGAGIPLAVAGAYMGLVGRSLEQRQQMLGQVAELESLEAGLMGNVDALSPNFIKEEAPALNKLGFNQLQTAELVNQIASAAGMKVGSSELRGGRLRNIAAAQKMGIPAEVLAATAGAIAQATSKSVGDALDESLNLKNLAEQGLDLRGSGVSAFLQSFAGLVDRFAAEGLTVDSKALSRELFGIAKATGARGERAGQLTSSLIDVAGSAGGDIRSTLQNFGRNLLTADAASRSTDLFSFLRQTENLQTSPSRVARIIGAGAGGGRDGAAVLASFQGIGTKEAVDLMRARQRGATFGARVEAGQIEDRSKISAAFAASQDAALNLVSQDKDQGVKLIEISSQMQQALLKVSENETTLTTLAAGLTATIDLISGTQDKVNDALDWIRRNL